MVGAYDLASIELVANRQAMLYAEEVQKISKNIKPTDVKQFSQMHQLQEPIEAHLKKVSQVLVFLSFSMPEKSLRAWLIQCKESGATPVIRGLINNSFKDTMSIIQSLSKDTGIGMQLDPILFKTFEINRVPAVVYVKAVPECPENMNCRSIDYDKVFGDVTLDYALDTISNESSSEDTVLKQKILQLRGDSL